MRMICPCCNGRGEIDDQLPVPMTRMQQKIYEIVRRHPRGIASGRVINQVYADRSDGGPLHARESMFVIICRLNRKIRGHNLRIDTGPTGGEEGLLKLRKLDARN
jgi:hypothetical protein